MEIGAEINEQQSVVPIFSKEAQHECLRSQHRAVNRSATLRSKDRIFPTQSQQIAMQRVLLRVFFALGEIELRSLETIFISRIWKRRLRHRKRDAWELF